MLERLNSGHAFFTIMRAWVQQTAPNSGLHHSAVGYSTNLSPPSPDVANYMNICQSLIVKAKESFTLPEAELNAFVDKLFAFSFVWSLAGSVREEG